MNAANEETKKDSESGQEEHVHMELIEQSDVEVMEESMAEAKEDMGDLFHKVQEELSTLQDRYLRLGAEFENFKKRSDREKQVATRFATENLLAELLPIIDHLEQALLAAENGSKNGGSAAYDNVVVGVKMVLRQFQDVLARFGIQSFSALGQMFDPQKHEAVSEREDAQVQTGQVLEEFQKGYMLHERLVRPARVVVARAPQT